MRRRAEALHSPLVALRAVSPAPVVRIFDMVCALLGRFAAALGRKPPYPVYGPLFGAVSANT